MNDQRSMVNSNVYAYKSLLCSLTASGTVESPRIKRSFGFLATNSGVGRKDDIVGQILLSLGSQDDQMNTVCLIRDVAYRPVVTGRTANLVVK